MSQFFETYQCHEKLSVLLTELPAAHGQFKDSYLFEFLGLPDNHKEHLLIGLAPSLVYHEHNNDTLFMAIYTLGLTRPLMKII